jgi:hypothetical protein
MPFYRKEGFEKNDRKPPTQIRNPKRRRFFYTTADRKTAGSRYKKPPAERTLRRKKPRRRETFCGCFPGSTKEIEMTNGREIKTALFFYITADRETAGSRDKKTLAERTGLCSGNKHGRSAFYRKFPEHERKPK